MSRSPTRGREYESSGRGGAGNIRPSSRDPVSRGQGPDDFSPSRGREFQNTYDEPVTHSGRGGAGNIRSPSRDPEKERKAYQQDQAIVKEYDQHQNYHASGRGGAGNIERSRSRDGTKHRGVFDNIIGRISRDASRERGSTETPPHHTAGRGGYGNTYGNAASQGINRVEEEERGQYRGSTDEGMHSSGRGGYGNTSTNPGAGTYDKNAPHHTTGHSDTASTEEYTSSGRGGVGNIHGSITTQY